MGLVPQGLRDHIDRFLRDNSERTDVKFGSVECPSWIEPVHSESGVSGTVAVDLSEANWFEYDCTGDVTLSMENVSTDPGGNSVTVYLNDGDGSGPHSITWPSGTIWPGGSSVTEVPGSGDVEVAMTTPDGGSTWRASQRGSSWS